MSDKLVEHSLQHLVHESRTAAAPILEVVIFLTVAPETISLSDASIYLASERAKYPLLYFIIDSIVDICYSIIIVKIQNNPKSTQ